MRAFRWEGRVSAATAFVFLLLLTAPSISKDLFLTRILNGKPKKKGGFPYTLPGRGRTIEKSAKKRGEFVLRNVNTVGAKATFLGLCSLCFSFETNLTRRDRWQQFEFYFFPSVENLWELDVRVGYFFRGRKSRD